jgi:hypothetical protein
MSVPKMRKSALLICALLSSIAVSGCGMNGDKGDKGDAGPVPRGRQVRKVLKDLKELLERMEKTPPLLFRSSV